MWHCSVLLVLLVRTLALVQRAHSFGLARRFISTSCLYTLYGSACCRPEDTRRTEEGLSTDLICSETSLHASWNITKTFSYQARTEGVEYVNSLMYSCTFNGTLIVPPKEIWRGRPFSPTHTFTENATLPVGAVCVLTGCYRWSKPHQTGYVENFDYEAPEKTCTIAGSTPDVKPVPTTTVMSSSRVVMASTSVIMTSVIMTTAVPSVMPSPTAPPQPDPLAGGDSADLLLILFVLLLGVILLVSALLILIMWRLVKRRNCKLRHIKRKYFNDLDNFDNFYPVDPTKIISSHSIPSLYDAFFTGEGNTKHAECDYTTLVHPGTYPGKLHANEGNAVQEGSSTPSVNSALNIRYVYEPFVSNQSLCRASTEKDGESLSVSLSLDMLSLASTDNEQSLPSRHLLIQSISQTDDYIGHEMMEVSRADCIVDSGCKSSGYCDEEDFSFVTDAGQRSCGCYSMMGESGYVIDHL